MSAMAAELVVVTGAGAGIGRALARAFSAAGHPCLLISRHLEADLELEGNCLLYTSPSPRDGLLSRMPSSA